MIPVQESTGLAHHTHTDNVNVKMISPAQSTVDQAKSEVQRSMNRPSIKRRGMGRKLKTRKRRGPSQKSKTKAAGKGRKRGKHKTQSKTTSKRRSVIGKKKSTKKDIFA